MVKANEKKWNVYIIKTLDGKLYTGITNNLERRFKDHSQKEGRGAKFFHFSTPEAIIFMEEHENRSEASKREWQIKKMSREEKLQLVHE